VQLAAELHAILLPARLDDCVHAWLTLLVHGFRGG
jgi:hypothetical protein